MQEIRESLEPLTRKSASLDEEKEQLKKEINKNEKLQEKLLSQKASLEDTKIFDETITNLQATIDANRKRLLANVEAKIEKKKIRENQLKLEAAMKEKELDENR